MPMVVKNYLYSDNLLKFVKEYGAKDLLENLNIKNWNEYLMTLNKLDNSPKYLILTFEEHNNILGLVTCKISKNIGDVFSIVLKSNELFFKINKIVEDRLKELGCDTIEYKITNEQRELLSEINSNWYIDYKVRMEKEL